MKMHLLTDNKCVSYNIYNHVRWNEVEIEIDLGEVNE